MNEHHYQRIDKGVRRKYPAVPAYTSVAKTPLKSLPEARRAQIAAEVLVRYGNGEQVAAMAPEYECSDVTLYALLLKDHESVWKDLQIARSLAKLESSKDRLETAQDPLNLARAREQIRAAQWELERLLSRIFGVKSEMNVNLNTPVFMVQVISNQADLEKVINPESMLLPDKP